MKYIQNLHTHTVYCDGNDTPEEMIVFAKAKGFESIGFSGHSYMDYSDYMRGKDKTAEYIKDITALKEKYKGDFEIFLGLEVDMYSKIDPSLYEYLIGSVHYLKIGEEYVGFDRSAEVVQDVINRHFGGDGMAFARRYYEELALLPKYGNFDIIGHFDLISKNLDKICFFDEHSKEYLDAAFGAIEALKGKIPLFEVNTGAIARGYRKVPYPSPEIIKEFLRQGFGAVITSDCHNGEQLDCGFLDARELLLECGFKERYILTSSGFAPVSL